MDVWRQMAAASVPGVLAFVGTNMEAPGFITVAQMKLNGHIHLLRLRLQGVLPDQIDFNNIDVPPVRVCPTAYIRAALRTVGLDAAYHAMVRHVFALYARARPNLEDTPAWRAWSGDRARVDAHADEAILALRAALGFARASFGAISVADSSFPHQSADWTAWMLAAERNARLAVQSTAVAVDQLQRMRQAAMAEYGKARILTDTAGG
ncbi:unnamed protein product [Urochloa humidicola]